MDEKYLSRKFILAVFVIISSISLLIFNLLPVTSYTTLVVTTLGLYYTGNVASSVANNPTKQP
jgi:MFS-type transporter involved in bile tolerance (Atg22 family)